MTEVLRHLAIDLGERHLAVGVVNADGVVGVRDRIATPPKDRLTALERLVDRVLAATPASSRPTICVVTGPGPIDDAAGASAPLGIPGWQQLPIRDTLQQTTRLETILETTGRAYALAACDGIDSVIGLHLGDEVDGGVVVGGRLLNGAHHRAGGFAHLLVDPDGVSCVCGALGCLGAYAGVHSIETSTGRGLVSTPSALVTRAGIMVARAVASLVATTDVRSIRIGGVVVEAFRERFIESLNTELEERLRLPHLAGIDLKVAQFHVLAGASAIARSIVATSTPSM